MRMATQRKSRIFVILTAKCQDLDGVVAGVVVFAVAPEGSVNSLIVEVCGVYWIKVLDVGHRYHMPYVGIVVIEKPNEGVHIAAGYGKDRLRRY